MDNRRAVTFEGRGGLSGQIWIPESYVVIYPTSDNNIPCAAVIKAQDALPNVDIRTDSFPHRISNVQRFLARRCAGYEALQARVIFDLLDPVIVKGKLHSPHVRV